ncbi:hypothetical protein C8R47DRAFT_1023391, partial [Mycena vitilis]
MPATSAAALQQILPLVILIVLPILTLRVLAFLRPRIRRPLMALGALLPWNWGQSSSEKKLDHGKKRRVRTRAEQVAESKINSNDKSRSSDLDSDAHFPGLVNMSGTHCFMNSTLQALASLSSLPPYLLAIRTRAEALDVPTPVVDALLDLLAALNSPASSGQPLRAIALVEALCTPPPDLSIFPSSDSLALSPLPRSGASAASPAASALSAFWDAASPSASSSAQSNNNSLKAAALLASHEHQDAQELFQLISECVREESARVGREGARDRGFGGALGLTGTGVNGKVATPGGSAGEGVGVSPFDGLTATRRACVRCGYTAAIRHFAFDSVQLALESAGGWGGTNLPTLLRAYTALEVLHDCPCRRCALRATARRLAEEDKERHADGEKDGDGPIVTASRLRRLKAVRRMEARVRRALEAGRTGDALKGVRIERVPGGVCTRQSMIGRPPAVLALHINRSVHTGMRVAKNTARVAFPEILDLAPYTTGGVLNLEPTAALSGTIDANGHIAFPSHIDPAIDAVKPGGGEECLYRLAAAVCHFGQHSFGHYICYRRAPVPVAASSSSSSSAAFAPAPPTHEGSAGTGTGWLRISDARVDRCGVEQVLSEGSAVFMLYYERVPQTPSATPALPSPAPSPHSQTHPVPEVQVEEEEVYAGDSAETITPAHYGAGARLAVPAVSMKASGCGSGFGE